MSFLDLHLGGRTKMKKNNKRALKIIAGLVAIGLIIAILAITNAFVGNPISMKLAERAIDKHVEENYSDLDLQVGKVYYDFKDGAYRGDVHSNRSVDTSFVVYYSRGKIYRDTYEGDVLELWNTIQRLSADYSNLAREIIAQDLGYEENKTFVDYHEDLYENPDYILELDMSFDRELPIPANISMHLDVKKASLEKADHILKQAHRAFKENRCDFKLYHLTLEDEQTRIYIMNLLPEDIEGDNLLGLLTEKSENDYDTVVEEGQDKEEIEGLYVDIMEKRD